MELDYDAYEEDYGTAECSHEWIICPEKAGKKGFFMCCKYCGIEYKKENLHE